MENNPYPDFHLASLDFDLDSPNLHTYQLALIFIHPLATQSQRDRAELLLSRARARDVALGKNIGEAEKEARARLHNVGKDQELTERTGLSTSASAEKQMTRDASVQTSVSCSPCTVPPSTARPSMPSPETAARRDASPVFPVKPETVDEWSRSDTQQNNVFSRRELLGSDAGPSRGTSTVYRESTRDSPATPSRKPRWDVQQARHTSCESSIVEPPRGPRLDRPLQTEPLGPQPSIPLYDNAPPEFLQRVRFARYTVPARQITSELILEFIRRSSFFGLAPLSVTKVASRTNDSSFFVAFHSSQRAADATYQDDGKYLPSLDPQIPRWSIRVTAVVEAPPSSFKVVWSSVDPLVRDEWLKNGAILPPYLMARGDRPPPGVMISEAYERAVASVLEEVKVSRVSRDRAFETSSGSRWAPARQARYTPTPASDEWRDFSYSSAHSTPVGASPAPPPAPRADQEDTKSSSQRFLDSLLPFVKPFMNDEAPRGMKRWGSEESGEETDPAENKKQKLEGRLEE